MSGWPDDGPGALCLSFDNLGEAAEIELGAVDPNSPSIGTHFTATEVLPSLLAELGSRELRATFFVEGINAEHYPEQLAEIAAAGHEVGYHAWRHETWADLSAAEQAVNLERGVSALRGLGLAPSGLRPPGGGLGEGGVEIPREAGLRYCSPAGSGAGWADGVALVPFRWRDVDATCLLPGLGRARVEMAGSEDPVDPGTFLASLEGEIGRLAQDGGLVTFVLHLSMVGWLGEDRLAALLDRVAEASLRGGAWVARCADVADRVLAAPGAFEGGTELDETSWSAG
jgi:hypothetical protein